MRIRLRELREMISEAISEGMASHAREATRLYDEFMNVVQGEPEKLDISLIKKGIWILKGSSLGIPEFANVSFEFRSEENGFNPDEQYGMYSNDDETDTFKGRKMGKSSGTPRDVPEKNRRYVVSFMYVNETIWSRQKLIRQIPKIVDRETWFHEMGHLITSRVVPSKPHAKNFFRDVNKTGDHEETLGMFIQEFDRFYAKYADKPEEFKTLYPTFKDFYVKTRQPFGTHMTNLGRGRETFGDEKLKARVERWYMKKVYEIYNDLSSV